MKKIRAKQLKYPKTETARKRRTGQSKQGKKVVPVRNAGKTAKGLNE